MGLFLKQKMSVKISYNTNSLLTKTFAMGLPFKHNHWASALQLNKLLCNENISNFMSNKVNKKVNSRVSSLKGNSAIIYFIFTLNKGY